MTDKAHDEKFVSVSPTRYPCNVKDKKAAELVERIMNWHLGKPKVQEELRKRLIHAMFYGNPGEIEISWDRDEPSLD